MSESPERVRVASESHSRALKAFVTSVEQLPLFTGMAVQLVRSAERDDVTAGELSRLVSTDPALAAHLLRMANSPYFGLARRIGVVTDAITILGLNLVRRIVTAEVLRRPFFAYLHDAPDVRLFWRHQLLCAGLARHLHLRKGSDGEAAYMAGLLHDVGRLLMVIRFPLELSTLLKPHDLDDTDTLDQERTRFGFDHAEVGAALLELWDMPEAYVIAAGQHVDELEPDEPLAASVWNANLLSMQIEHEPVDDEEDAPWAVAVGLDAKNRKRILDEVSALEGD